MIGRLLSGRVIAVAGLVFAGLLCSGCGERETARQPYKPERKVTYSPPPARSRTWRVSVPRFGSFNFTVDPEGKAITGISNLRVNIEQQSRGTPSGPGWYRSSLQSTLRLESRKVELSGPCPIVDRKFELTHQFEGSDVLMTIQGEFNASGQAPAGTWEMCVDQNKDLTYSCSWSAQ